MIMIDINTIPEFYQGYVRKLKHGSVIENLQKTSEIFTNLLRMIPESKGECAYAKGKWTVKEVIQHLIDVERMFSYRALRFARMDKTALSGFEQNDYVAASKVAMRPLDSLLLEFQHIRTSTIDLYQSFDQEMMAAIGTVNGLPFAVEAVGYITSGHCLHHTDILKAHYLSVD